MPHTGNLAHNPGTCPDCESNWRPFGLQPARSPLSHTSQGLIFFKWMAQQSTCALQSGGHTAEPEEELNRPAEGNQAISRICPPPSMIIILLAPGQLPSGLRENSESPSPAHLLRKHLWVLSVYPHFWYSAQRHCPGLRVGRGRQTRSRGTSI